MWEVEDINLNVGTGTEIGESIIQDVNGLFCECAPTSGWRLFALSIPYYTLVSTSFNKEDEDYKSHDYNLFYELSEVRIDYLNRFVQEVVGYFMGLVPNSPKVLSN
ncbi:Vacuolar protein sorting-associated protein 13C [Senna tora]|uniref:Vacuolar protein sorting-associated protein 13C n=1 Tax=Senna tora TaxID=362788 RepID=A0A834WNR8_9FABA|nr:Vacuolar protein sorting-associated protein 13C [Senna tora]